MGRAVEARHADRAAAPRGANAVAGHAAASDGGGVPGGRPTVAPVSEEREEEGGDGQGRRMRKWRPPPLTGRSTRAKCGMTDEERSGV